MLVFENYVLNKVEYVRNEFKEEVTTLIPKKTIQVKVTHKESLEVGEYFDLKTNNFNGYTLCKQIEKGDVLTRGDKKLRVVYVNPVPRLSTLVLEVL